MTLVTTHSNGGASVSASPHCTRDVIGWLPVEGTEVGIQYYYHQNNTPRFREASRTVYQGLNGREARLAIVCSDDDGPLSLRSSRYS
ncbi:hypothetical protein ACOMHN_015121 [Nucella lapillus]